MDMDCFFTERQRILTISVISACTQFESIVSNVQFKILNCVNFKSRQRRNPLLHYKLLSASNPPETFSCFVYSWTVHLVPCQPKENLHTTHQSSPTSKKNSFNSRVNLVMLYIYILVLVQNRHKFSFFWGVIYKISYRDVMLTFIIQMRLSFSLKNTNWSLAIARHFISGWLGEEKTKETWTMAELLLGEM